MNTDLRQGASLRARRVLRSDERRSEDCPPRQLHAPAPAPPPFPGAADVIPVSAWNCTVAALYERRSVGSSAVTDRRYNCQRIVQFQTSGGIRRLKLLPRRNNERTDIRCYDWNSESVFIRVHPWLIHFGVGLFSAGTASTFPPIPPASASVFRQFRCRHGRFRLRG